MFQPRPSANLVLLLILGGPFAAPAQTVAPAPAADGFALSTLRPALANVQTAIGNLSIPRWKTSSATRAVAAQDVASMQKDLSTTLPGLMSQAEAQPSGPAALSPSFAVFRNLDALYDVLLRVTETAALTGPSSDANILEQARAGLEDARSQLGAWLLQSIGAQDAQVVRLLAAPPPPPPAAAPPPPTKIVINDGPDAPKPRKKKPGPTPPPSPQ